MIAGKNFKFVTVYAFADSAHFRDKWTGKEKNTHRRAVLVEHSCITPAQLEIALEKQKTDGRGKKIGEILIDMGYLTYDSLLSYLDTQVKV